MRLIEYEKIEDAVSLIGGSLQKTKEAVIADQLAIINITHRFKLHFPTSEIRYYVDRDREDRGSDML